MGRQNLSKPISLRVAPKVREKVKKISDDTGLLQAQVFDTILQAGCMALDEIADEDIEIDLENDSEGNIVVTGMSVVEYSI